MGMGKNGGMLPGCFAACAIAACAACDMACSWAGCGNIMGGMGMGGMPLLLPAGGSMPAWQTEEGAPNQPGQNAVQASRLQVVAHL